MVGWVRLELTTNGLKGRCSTIELPAQKGLVNPLDFTNDPTLSKGTDPILLVLSAIFVGSEVMRFVNDGSRGHISIDGSILTLVNERVFFSWELHSIFRFLFVIIY